MHYSLKDKVKASVQASRKEVFLRSDFDHFGNYRQVTRALGELQKERVLMRAGYGIYTKPAIGSDLSTVIQKVRSRLPGRRVKRHVTVDGATVLLGYKAERRNAQTELDKYKLRLAKTVLSQFPLSVIRHKSLSNLDRWEAHGVWVSAHDEWRTLMCNGTDAEVIAVMTGEDQNANRLRQSAPFAGLLNAQTLEKLRETARS